MVQYYEKNTTFAYVEEKEDKKMTPEEKLWYPLRVTYNRELKVKADLDSLGVTNFVPMQYRREERNGRMVKRLVPSVHNLIFVKMTPREMIEYKKTTALPIRYIMNRETHRPIIVPNHEMENFIKVAGTYEEQLIYLNPNPGDFAKGERVRVIGGPFAGAEGIFIRVKGDRRVLINIPGVVAVASTFIHPSMIEKITDPEPNALDNAL